MIKMKPIQFKEEDIQKVQEELGTQTEERGVPKSLDPKNYPVFEVPVNSKVLVYVPKFEMQNPEEPEKKMLRMDRPLVHSVQVGKMYQYYRCTYGFNMPEYGLDGTCPFCEDKDYSWELANLRIAEKCKAAGVDPEDKDNAVVKGIRTAEYSDMVVRDCNREYTFPIAVIETKDNDGKTIVKDEKGNVKVTMMWYQISKQKYEQEWEKALESLEDEPETPAGLFFTLNYTYTPKTGSHNKRDSARHLKVNVRRFSNSKKLAESLDKLAEDWTPVKAQQTVIKNVLYPVADLRKVCDDALLQTKATIELMKNADVPVGKSFKLEEKPSVPETTEEDAGAPVGETDDDIDIDVE